MTTHVILDLDQTIISAETPKEIDLTGQDKIKAKKFTFHDMDNYYIVFERPGLQKFLDFLFANFSVSVWTAASKDYAAFIIKNIQRMSRNNIKKIISGTYSENVWKILGKFLEDVWKHIWKTCGKRPENI